MQQGYDGQWYDDNGNPIDLSQGQSDPPPVYTIGNGPNANNHAQPMPGYDDQHDPYQGSWQINDNNGSWSWLPKGYSTTHQGDATPPVTTETGGGSTGGQLASPGSAQGFWPTYNIPAPYQFTPYGDFKEFSYDKYAPLTGEQAAAEPGYAFARDQGRDAIQASQAAKGNILSGAALKDLFAWGDQFAGQNYQNAENRNENIYTMNRGNAYNNWAANESGKYKQWEGNTDKGLAAWNANLQPGQFAATLGTQQQGMTLADLLARFKTTADSLSTIAAGGAK